MRKAMRCWLGFADDHPDRNYFRSVKDSSGILIELRRWEVYTRFPEFVP